MILAGAGRRQGLRRISQHAMANALVIPFDAQLPEDGFALFALELLLGPVDPAAAQALVIGGQHQVAHYQAAIVQIGGFGFIRQHHQYHRGAIKGIVAFFAHYFGIHCGKLIPHFLIGDRNNNGRLPAAARRRIGTCLQNLIDGLLGYHIRLIGPNAATF